MDPKPLYVAIKALIIKEDKLLLVFKSKENFWDIPGGRMNPGETVIQTLKRELSEELPDFKAYRIQDLVGIRKRETPLLDGNEILLLYFLVESKSAENKFTLSLEHTVFKFFSLKDLLQLEDPLGHVYSNLLQRVLRPGENQSINEMSVIV